MICQLPQRAANSSSTLLRLPAILGDLLLERFQAGELGRFAQAPDGITSAIWPWRWPEQPLDHQRFPVAASSKGANLATMTGKSFCTVSHTTWGSTSQYS